MARCQSLAWRLENAQWTTAGEMSFGIIHKRFSANMLHPSMKAWPQAIQESQLLLLVEKNPCHTMPHYWWGAVSPGAIH
jgi:hypothetical protein